MRVRLELFMVVILGVSLAACASGARSTPTATPAAAGPPQTGPARVTGLEVLQIAAARPEIRVVARGQLQDGCERLLDPAVERAGSEIRITLLSARLTQADCPPGPVDFERVISPDLSGLGPGPYAASVNGLTTTFELASASLAQAAPTNAPAPTAEPTLVPAAPTSAPTAVDVNPPAPTAAATNPPAPTSAPTAAAAASRAGCVDKLAFFADVSVPDDSTFQQGETFVKTWRLRNEGTCALDGSYSLVFGGGDQMNGPLTQALEQTVPPNGIFDISVKLTAPTRGGPHVGNWQFQNSAGQHFGVGVAGADYIWVKIQTAYAGQSGGGTASAASGAAGGSGGGCAQRDSNYESEVLALVNNARAANGLPGLALQPGLTAAALAHSADMACRDFVDHTGSDGSTWNSRVAAQGYAYSTIKENLYVGNPAFGGTPAGAFNWWMNSSIHRNNILSLDMASIGVAYVFNPASTYGGYYTLVFARP